VWAREQWALNFKRLNLNRSRDSSDAEFSLQIHTTQHELQQNMDHFLSPFFITPSFLVNVTSISLNFSTMTN